VSDARVEVNGGAASHEKPVESYGRSQTHLPEGYTAAMHVRAQARIAARRQCENLRLKWERYVEVTYRGMLAAILARRAKERRSGRGCI
jgi:hypothetical protein